MPTSKPSAARFDAAYYTRYYESKTTRVHDAKRIAHLARAVTELIAWNDGTLESVLDIGAGTGLWRDWFKKHKKDVRYRSTEYSAYACERYGHEQRDIATWRARETFDLVVCQGVLPYLDDARAEAAIDNIGAMTRGFLYLEAITKSDLRDVCDQEMTDSDLHVRTGAWYRTRHSKHFDHVGCGLYYSKQGNLLFYELERSL
jgi:2-polyprenyl-3-methyl-5-hydroxy-6-metoxy-1,4-benzoquinol methylase